MYKHSFKKRFYGNDIQKVRSMSEQIRIGDITGFDDAEVIEIEDDVYLVIDNDYDNTEN